MYQPIKQKIAVAGVYESAYFSPRKFKYRSREYVVQKITVTADVKDGGVRKRFYSVVANDNIFRLCFDREREIWTLEEAWID